MKMSILLVILAGVTCGAAFSQKALPYFPPLTFYDDSPTLDAATVRWYSTCLNLLGEPSLWATSKDFQRQAYRFLWLRAWDQPISLRVDRNDDGTGTLTLRVATDSGDCHTGKLGISRTKQLGKEEFEAIAHGFAAAEFWTMTPTELSGGKDGAQWVLESTANGKYHAVKRWSPKVGPVRDLALLVLSLSDFKIADDRVY